ncbi:MAG: hypothetical protein HKN28_03840, partial [Alphaproteobacteria bacterium]|nr:hypothetical protein [Alphaproteobacteria bacterium]
AATTIASAAPSATAQPSLAAQTGSWVCLPDDKTAPQVFVDFEENIYRRCDQNICSQYEILAVRQKPDATEISFSPTAIFSADDAGGRYQESLKFGDAILTTSGACTFRSDEPEPDAFEREEMRNRS